MFETSYGSDSKCAVFPRSRRMFYIPRTCPQLLQKIFYRLSKSKTSRKKQKSSLDQPDSAQNILRVFWKFLTLRASKKFSIAVGDMFWVCKTFSQIGGTQRTLNQNRTTSQTFYFCKSVNPPPLPHSLDAASLTLNIFQKKSNFKHCAFFQTKTFKEAASKLWGKGGGLTLLQK